MGIDFLFTDMFYVLVWEISEIFAVIVFLANAVTIWLPNHSENKYLDSVLKFLNRLSMNIMKNANEAREVLRGHTKDPYSEFKVPEKRPKGPPVRRSDNDR